MCDCAGDVIGTSTPNVLLLLLCISFRMLIEGRDNTVSRSANLYTIVKTYRNIKSSYLKVQQSRFLSRFTIRVVGIIATNTKFIRTHYFVEDAAIVK